MDRPASALWPNPYTCACCGEGYPKLRELRRHMRVCPDNNERKAGYRGGSGRQLFAVPETTPA